MSSERKKRRKIWRFGRFVFSLAVIAGLTAWGVFWAKDLVLARQVQFVASQEGTLDSPIQVDALVANTEQLVTSPATGKLDKFLVQGERVRKNTAAARIIAQNSGAKIDLISPISGVLNYNIDGLEGAVTPKNLQEWDLSKFQLQPNPPAGDTFQSGQVVLKITDNLSPTYLMYKLTQPGLQLAKGDSVSLLIDQQKANGRVVRISDQGPSGGIVVAMNAFLPQSLGKRQLQIGWLDKNPPKGQIIPAAALLDKQGVKGVYIIKDGVVQWRQVTVLSQSADRYCVNGLSTATPVITTPAYVHTGQILNG